MVDDGTHKRVKDIVLENNRDIVAELSQSIRTKIPCRRLYPVAEVPSGCTWGDKPVVRSLACEDNTPLTLTIVARVCEATFVDQYGMPLNRVQLTVAPLRISDSSALRRFTDTLDKRRSKKSAVLITPMYFTFVADQQVSNDFPFFSIRMILFGLNFELTVI